MKNMKAKKVKARLRSPYQARKVKVRKVKAGLGSLYQVGRLRLQLGPVGLLREVREVNKA